MYRKVKQTLRSKFENAIADIIIFSIRSFLWIVNLILILGAFFILVFPVYFAFESGNHWVMIHMLYSWIPSLILGTGGLILFMFNVETMK